MKTISVMIPTYNEEENIVPITQAVIEVITKELPAYDYEIVIIDNCSQDKTRSLIKELCAGNPKIKAILNVTNFGQFNSPFYGLCQTSGDCTISICADFQDPVELIPTFVHEWENGYKIVCGVKTSSKENPIVYTARTIYYKLIHKFSEVDMIEHFTGFGLYDKSFIHLLNQLNDSMPFIRGIVAEYGFKRKLVEYEQPKRRAGKSSNNFMTLYDAAMLSFTSYTKVGLRIATFIGAFAAFGSIIVAIVYLIIKIANWNTMPWGTAPIMIMVCLIGAVQLLFIGVIGEYILNINKRVMNRPLVVEEERLNFEEQK